MAKEPEGKARRRSSFSALPTSISIPHPNATHDDDDKGSPTIDDRNNNVRMMDMSLQDVDMIQNQRRRPSMLQQQQQSAENASMVAMPTASAQPPLPSSSFVSPWCSLPTSTCTTSSTALGSLTQRQQTWVSRLSSSSSSSSSCSPVTALVAPSGRGKSHIASYYAQQQKQQASASVQVLWLHADTEWTLRASYMAVLRQYACNCETALGQQTTQQLAQTIATTLLKKSRSSSKHHEQWILVYDDVGMTPQQFFRTWSIPVIQSSTASPARTVQTILTTTLMPYQNWQQDNYQAIVVEALPLADCKALFLQPLQLDRSDHPPPDATRAAEGSAAVAASKEEKKLEEESLPLTDPNDVAALDILLPMLQGLPLAITTARAQWHQLEISLAQYVDQLTRFRDDHYKKQKQQQHQVPSSEASLHWFWAFGIHPLWESSHNRQDYHHALIVLSLVHPQCIPASVLQKWDIVLLQLQAWKIVACHLYHNHSNSSHPNHHHNEPTSYYYFYSIPICLQQAIRRRVSMDALGIAVEACQVALTASGHYNNDHRPLQFHYHTSNSRGHGARLKDPMAFLPHVETLKANIDLLGVNLPPNFPRQAYADLLLQTGIVLQRAPLADYPRAISYLQQGLSISLGLIHAAAQDRSDGDSTTGQSAKAIARACLYRLGLIQATAQDRSDGDSTTGQAAKAIARACLYRLSKIARVQNNFDKARDYALQSLALYDGFDKLGVMVRDKETTPLTKKRFSKPVQQLIPTDLTQDVKPEDWNVLCQLFHTCGHASWKLEDILEARMYFQYELAVKQAWLGKDQPHDRVARTLNNLASVCRECGDLPAALDYGTRSLEMQQALGKPDNLEAATILNNLGSLSYSLCDYIKAHDYFELALEMKQKCYTAQQQQSGNNKPMTVKNQDIAETLHNLGMLSDHLGDYDTAKKYYEDSLDCKYAVYGKKAQNADLATTLTSLGLLTMNHGYYDLAKTYYDAALGMQQSFYQEQDHNMEIVRTLHGLGILNYHLGKLQESREFHSQAVEMQQEMERQQQQQHPSRSFLADPRTANLSQIMQNLGNLSHNLGEYDDARKYYEQGLTLYSQVCADHAKEENLQRMLGKLQKLNSSSSSYGAARTYYEQALEMKFFIYGKDAMNSDLAFTLQSLALLNDNVGHYEEAKRNYEKALDMLHHLYGGENARNGEIAGALHGLGTVAFNCGQYGESEHYFKESLAMKETVYGGADANNGDLATSHVSLGTLAHSVGEYDDAKFHLEKALDMQKKLYGDIGENEQNIELAVTYNCLANLYRDLGQLDKALAFYEKAVKHMGKDSENPFLATVLADLGALYRLRGEYDKAEDCLLRAMNLQRKLYGEDAQNAEMAYTLMNLGKLYLDKGKYTEAEECLNRALKMQQHAFGTGDVDEDNVVHLEVAETLQALGDLAHRMGDLELSKKYLEDYKAMCSKIYGEDDKRIEMARNLESLGGLSAKLDDEEAVCQSHGESATIQKEISELVADAPQAEQTQNSAHEFPQESTEFTERETGDDSIQNRVPPSETAPSKGKENHSTKHEVTKCFEEKVPANKSVQNDDNEEEGIDHSDQACTPTPLAEGVEPGTEDDEEVQCSEGEERIHVLVGDVQSSEESALNDLGALDTRKDVAEEKNAEEVAELVGTEPSAEEDLDAQKTNTPVGDDGTLPVEGEDHSADNQGIGHGTDDQPPKREACTSGTEQTSPEHLPQETGAEGALPDGDVVMKEATATVTTISDGDEVGQVASDFKRVFGTAHDEDDEGPPPMDLVSDDESQLSQHQEEQPPMDWAKFQFAARRASNKKKGAMKQDKSDQTESTRKHKMERHPPKSNNSSSKNTANERKKATPKSEKLAKKADRKIVGSEKSEGAKKDDAISKDRAPSDNSRSRKKKAAAAAAIIDENNDKDDPPKHAKSKEKFDTNENEKRRAIPEKDRDEEGPQAKSTEKQQATNQNRNEPPTRKENDKTEKKPVNRPKKNKKDTTKRTNEEATRKEMAKHSSEDKESKEKERVASKDAAAVAAPEKTKFASDLKKREDVEAASTLETGVSSQDETTATKRRGSDSSFHEQASGEASGQPCRGNQTAVEGEQEIKVEKERDLPVDRSPSKAEPEERKTKRLISGHTALAADGEEKKSLQVQRHIPELGDRDEAPDAARGMLLGGNHNMHVQRSKPKQPTAKRHVGPKGVGPVTDMPPRHRPEVDPASCGCWPFLR
jgi:tetratricopeptide (TPR) repeat protein